MESIEAQFVDETAETDHVNAAISHEAPVGQQVPGLHPPVANVEAKEGVLLSGEAEFGFDIGIPPDVVHVGGDAEVGMLEGFADFAGFGHTVDAAFVGGIHGMKRFDGQFHAGGFGMGKQSGDAVADLFAGFGQGLAGDGSDDEDHHIGANGPGFVQVDAVLLNGLSALCLGFAGEKTTAHEGGDLQSAVVNLFCGLFQADTPFRGIDEISPYGDSRNADLLVVRQTLGKVPGFIREGMDGDFGVHGLCGIHKLVLVKWICYKGWSYEENKTMATKTLQIKRRKKIVLAPKSVTMVHEDSGEIAVPDSAFVSQAVENAVYPPGAADAVIPQGLQTGHFFDVYLAESQKLKPPTVESKAPRPATREVLGAPTFKFFCCRCGQKLQVPMAWASKMHTCKSCGHEIVIPPPLMGDVW